MALRLARWRSQRWNYAATNQAIACCSPHELIDIDYLFWTLQRLKGRIISLGRGGAQPNISQRILLECEVPIAPLAEQRRIVARVDALFAEIAEGEAALAQARQGLDIFRRALLRAAVTGELTKDWRAANPVSETGHDLLARIAKDRAENIAAKGRRPRGDDAQISIHLLADTSRRVGVGDLRQFGDFRPNQRLLAKEKQRWIWNVGAEANGDDKGPN